MLLFHSSAMKYTLMTCSSCSLYLVPVNLPSHALSIYSRHPSPSGKWRGCEWSKSASMGVEMDGWVQYDRWWVQCSDMLAVMMNTCVVNSLYLYRFHIILKERSPSPAPRFLLTVHPSTSNGRSGLSFSSSRDLLHLEWSEEQEWSSDAHWIRRITTVLLLCSAIYSLFRPASPASAVPVTGLWKGAAT